ncbi:MOSC domain-containing protein [Ornithinicoccus halotolerans]|uniref:MOSC domain-containing protein n=1 Tax=Ornithinicoccus halotolerans TaxID=1748220 RepID=UPI001E54B513|nr:MOSC domain-containing protein [Ornithinicoccus halotolerans]
MTPSVLSVNLGRSRPTATNRCGRTGIDKRPAAELWLRAPGVAKGVSGAVGDVIGDTPHHGGDSQAVYLVAAEELAHWSGELAGERLPAPLRLPLPPGAFGENLTTTGVDVDGWRVGTRLAVGEQAVLEVTGPRVPCATFAERMGVRGWVRRFAERGRTGAYAAVLEPGPVRPGDRLRVLDVPGHGVDVPLVFRALMGDRAATRAVLDAGALRPDVHATLAERAAARG